MYNFYYDESQHSRKINDKTIRSNNYYDNFVSVIVGWPKEKEPDVFEKYLAFEKKYAVRKNKKGELKSETLKQSQFEFGFASMNKHNVQFVDDFLSAFDEDTKLYFSIASKIEYLVSQLFAKYKQDIGLDMDAVKYSITKALVIYRPEKVINCIFDSPESFVEVLKDFFRERIECNKKNVKLKWRETRAFSEILDCLENVSEAPKIDWVYYMPFDGFRMYLKEEKITCYSLTIDKEGAAEQESKTLQAAHYVGLENAVEADSLTSCGIRIADMMAGILSKLLIALCTSLHDPSLEENATKKILDVKWFQVNKEQLRLYKKLYKIVCEWDCTYYKTYSGIYTDDLIALIALLKYMNNFESIEKIQDEKLSQQGEYFNTFVCHHLQAYFDRRRDKLPLELITNTNNEFFLNKRGEKVCYNIENQPFFSLNEDKTTVDVLSIGMGNMAVPLITILENEGPVCYKLPLGLRDWAYDVIAISNMGENLFPAQVVFSKVNGRYCAEIL